MYKKFLTVFLMLVLVVAFTAPASAACPKSSCTTCKTDACCKGKLCLMPMNCTSDYIKIVNGKNVPQTLTNYKIQIKCAGCKTIDYKIKPVTLKPGQALKVYTGKGINSKDGRIQFMGYSGDRIKCKGMTVKFSASCGKVLCINTN